MWQYIKAGTTLMTAIKLAVIFSLVAGAFGTCAYYVHSYKQRGLKIIVLTNNVANCTMDKMALDSQLNVQNGRIVEYNARQRERIEASNKVIATMVANVRAQREENTALREALGAVRTETYKVAQNDEEFSDWIDNSVPPNGWRLLRNAAEGRTY